MTILIARRVCPQCGGQPRKPGGWGKNCRTCVGFGTVLTRTPWRTLEIGPGVVRGATNEASREQLAEALMLAAAVCEVR